MRAGGSLCKLHVPACVCAQSCPTLCNSMDFRPPGSSVHAILQAQIPSALPRPPPGDLPSPGIAHVSLRSPALADGSLPLDGETVETVTDFILGGSKITADGGCSHKIKRRLLLGREVMINIDSILKTANKDPSSQGYGFSNSQVWM